MIIKKDEDLKKHTTVRIGGTAKEYLIPENTEELIEVVKNKNAKYFIGGGSNLLISNREYDLVVDLSGFNDKIENLGDGTFRVGSSVRLQKLINTINDSGYGGIEYLFSVPGLIGGAIFMNAGRGEPFNQNISDFLVSVEVLRNGKTVIINKEDCKFKYRSSLFQETKDIIVSGLFCFNPMSREESKKLKRERIELCKQHQDNSHPNFGSVFMQCNQKIIKIAMKCKIGNKHVHFSSKTPNWIINENEGLFTDAISAIKKVEILHKLTGKLCKREVIVWE